MTMLRYSLILLSFFVLVSCESDRQLNTKKSTNDSIQFTSLDASITGVDFSNTIKESLYFNFINYSYVYNGGGVSAGDINNDGLVDLYFTANQESNKLYLNQGNFKFKDITKDAGVEDKLGWTTGTTMIDINNDGYMDIYVCKSGSLTDHQLRENLLFINQGDNTFIEEARKWGLNDAGFGTQAYFFDYDLDDDLDMYLVNHRADFKNNTNTELSIQNKITKHFSDQLYRNDGGRFVNVTAKSGIANNAWGLSASIGDFNNDNWPDVFVANDFLQPDYLYINNQDGTFTDHALSQFGHISQNSMGSDWADINNDGYRDLMVLEMSPDDHVRGKSNMPSMSTANFEQIVGVGYHYQYMVNTLQLNRGNGYFSDVAQMAGVAKSDWSWAPLLADFDEDGWNDLYVTNGILKDLSNSDYRKKIKARISSGVKMTLDEAMGMIPSNRLINYFYQNTRDLHFNKKTKDWGISAPTFSNGSAYADLDNDGDLDLVVNNAVDPAHIYRNNSENNSILVRLNGPAANVDGIGAAVQIFHHGKKQIKDQYLSRGYLSSVSKRIHFGLGKDEKIDSIKVVWPDRNVSTLYQVELGQIIEVDYRNNSIETAQVMEKVPLDLIGLAQIGVRYRHKEQNFNDLKKQLLLPHKLSQQGPHISRADVNGDGLEDFFVGGAAGQSASLFMQTSNGFDAKTGQWQLHQACEDLQSLFFDYDLDGDQDLYVVSGSYEFKETDGRLLDRLYKNDGNGNFTWDKNALPSIKTNGLTVKTSDIDGDGDLDLFVGGRLISGQYPYSPQSYLLENVGGRFVNSTSKLASDIQKMGMVSDAEFSDYDQDGDEDLIVVGEWNAIQIFTNEGGNLNKLYTPDLENTTGLWFSIEKVDMDKDGDDDYFVGNLGLNTKFKIGNGKEFHVYADDFDQSGNVDIVLTNKYKEKLVPVRGLECSSQQIPALKEKFSSFQHFATSSLEEIYGSQDLKNAFHIQADLLYSIYLENLGNGAFKVHKLPYEAQVSPIMDFEFVDLDNDGTNEILSVGNLYEAEVETVRYDASTGVVMSYKNGEFHVLDDIKTGFFFNGNARNIELIKREGDQILLIANNDDDLKAFRIKK